jgi:hypothetical protein
MFALTIPYTSKNSLLIVGDDAQSGMKRNVMRVTFVGVEQYDSFPPCGSAERSTTFGRSLAQLADFVRSRTSLLLDNPHPVDLFRPKTLKGAGSYPALQSTAFEADVVEWGSGRSVERVLI